MERCQFDLNATELLKKNTALHSACKSGNHDVVALLGPIHGFLFIGLIGMVAWGSIQKWWGWWFPAIVVITLGPIGSLIGDWIVRRELRQAG